MSKKGFQDFEIKSKVRALLVQYWFDTSSLSIGVHRGYVNVFGPLKEKSTIMTAKVIHRISNDPFINYSDDDEKQSVNDQDLNYDTFTARKMELAETLDSISQKLFNIENEIQKIPGVRSVSLDFSNYKKCGTIWRKRK